MPNTTNYNWATPADTDLVKDGAAAIRTLGSSADTTVKNLNPGTTAGDIDYYTSSTAKARIAIGTAGQVLKVNSGGTAPEWGTTADQTPLTTKGDLFTFDTADARLGVGANGTVLTADSAETTGLKWVAPASGGMTLLSTTALSGASTTISSINGSYNDLYVRVYNVQYSTGAAAFTFTQNGSSLSYYQTGSTQESSASAFLINNNNATGKISGLTLHRTGGENWFTLYFPNYSSTEKKRSFQVFGAFESPSDCSVQSGGAYRTNPGVALDTLTFNAPAGTFSGGTVLIYGVK
jgi:hypothetical protein